MDKKTVFVRTAKGAGEATNKTDQLYGDAKRVLLLVDDGSTVADITKRTPPSLRATLEKELQELVNGGFIRDSKEPENAPPALKFATPKFAAPKAAPSSTPAPAPGQEEGLDFSSTPAPAPEQEEELDFSFIAAIPPKAAPPKPSEQNPEAARTQTPAEAEAAARAKAAQMAQIEAAAAAAKARTYEEARARAKAEVEARTRSDAEARARQEAEAARQQAEKEAERLRAEAEAVKVKAEAELRARAIAAARIKQEAEAVRLKAEREAEQARAQLEAAKAKMEAEIRARVEAEARARQEAEAARLKAEREAEQARAELEAARVKAEAEARARIESEARAKAEIEARLKREAEEARLKAEQEEARARAKLAEAQARAEAEAKARLEEARLRAEAEVRIRAEVDARILREEEEARLEAAKMLVEREAAKAKAEADAKALVEAAARIKAEAEARLKQEEEEARIKAEKELADSLMDPAEKIRLSFAASAAASSETQGGAVPGFKFETFSDLPQAQTPAVVSAATEQRTQREAEAQQARAEQEAARRKAEQEAAWLKAEQEAARLKAEQEAARLRAEQQEAARKAAEKESARLRAEHEAYRAKVEQEEARAKAEQEARKQADEQGKAWEEAEQRAKVKAQAEKERLERQLAEEQTKAKAPPKPPRARRKPFPVGKIIAGLLVLPLLAVVVLPYVWPLDNYVSPLEQELSEQLRQPVHVGKINATLLPSPKLVLRDVTVGGARELKVGNVAVNFDFSALFSPTKSINQLQLSEVALNGQSLTAAMSWLQSAGGIEKYPVAHMELKSVRVSSDEIKVPSLNGHADFDPQGHFTTAEMKSEDGKLDIELETVQNHLQVEVKFHESTLPMLPYIPFNDLTATGEVTNGEIVFSDLFGHFFGGSLGGNARLNWQNGWLLQGRLIAKSLELQSLFPQFGITGELYGDVNVILSGARLAQMGDAPRMEGTFEAKRVVINKIDMETIARFGNRSDLGKGRTAFDEMKGALQADKVGQHFRQLELSSGVLSGSGQLDVAANQQLSGKLAVEVKGQRGNVPLIISGTPAQPVLKTR